MTRYLLASACAVLAFGTAEPLHAADTAPPAASAPAPGHGAVPATPRKRAAAPAARRPLVDINSASREQLMTLPGIGEADAERIIAGRPYRTKADLVTTHVLPVGPFLSIKGLIIAKPPQKTAGKV